MADIEIKTNESQTFTCQLYNATSLATVGSTFVPTESSPGVYRATVAQTGVRLLRCESTDVEVIGYVNLDVESGHGYSELYETYQQASDVLKEYPPVIRSLNDTKALWFLWPVTGATIAGTVIIDGATAVSVQGAITQTAITLAGQYLYKVAYDADDRPTAEGTAFYTLTDGTNTRYLALRLEGIPSKVYGSVPVDPTTGIISQIVIGDDYLETLGNHFEWTISEPTGYVAGTSTAAFGGQNLEDSTKTWEVAGTIVDNGSTWTLKFDLPGSATSSLPCGLYAWSVSVTNASSKRRTVVRASDDDEPTRLVGQYT